MTLGIKCQRAESIKSVSHVKILLFYVYSTVGIDGIFEDKYTLKNIVMLKYYNCFTFIL